MAKELDAVTLQKELSVLWKLDSKYYIGDYNVFFSTIPEALSFKLNSIILYTLFNSYGLAFPYLELWTEKNYMDQDDFIEASWDFYSEFSFPFEKIFSLLKCECYGFNSMEIFRSEENLGSFHPTVKSDFYKQMIDCMGYTMEEEGEDSGYGPFYFYGFIVKFERLYGIYQRAKEHRNEHIRSLAFLCERILETATPSLYNLKYGEDWYIGAYFFEDEDGNGISSLMFSQSFFFAVFVLYACEKLMDRKETAC